MCFEFWNLTLFVSILYWIISNLIGRSLSWSIFRLRRRCLLQPGVQMIPRRRMTTCCHRRRQFHPRHPRHPWSRPLPWRLSTYSRLWREDKGGYGWIGEAGSWRNQLTRDELFGLVNTCWDSRWDRTLRVISLICATSSQFGIMKLANWHQGSENAPS